MSEPESGTLRPCYGHSEHQVNGARTLVRACEGLDRWHDVVVHPEKVAGALFIAHIVVQTVHCELKHVAPTIRLFCFVGFPIGMAIPPAIILWLDRKSSGQVQGKGDAAAVPVTTEYC